MKKILFAMMVIFTADAFASDFTIVNGWLIAEKGYSYRICSIKAIRENGSIIIGSRYELDHRVSKDAREAIINYRCEK